MPSATAWTARARSSPACWKRRWTPSSFPSAITLLDRSNNADLLPNFWNSGLMCNGLVLDLRGFRPLLSVRHSNCNSGFSVCFLKFRIDEFSFGTDEFRCGDPDRAHQHGRRGADGAVSYLDLRSAAGECRRH